MKASKQLPAFVQVRMLRDICQDRLSRFLRSVHFSSAELLNKI